VKYSEYVGAKRRLSLKNENIRYDKYHYSECRGAPESVNYGNASFSKLSQNLKYSFFSNFVCLFLKSFFQLKWHFSKATPGPNVIKLFTPISGNKLECLSLASLSSRVECLWIRPSAFL
jgi:hypothetical protein